MVSETIILEASELENVIYQFKTKKDSIDETRPIIDLVFRKDDFELLEGEAAETLYKMAVF